MQMLFYKRVRHADAECPVRPGATALYNPTARDSLGEGVVVVVVIIPDCKSF